MNKTEQEKDLSALIYQAIQDYSRHDVRGAQSAAYRVGISDLGYCSERTRRMLDQQDPDDTDVLAAFIGTAIGKDMENAIKQARPDVILQAEVNLTLRSDTHTYVVPGHPDVIFPEGILLDGKTSRGLSIPERTGATDQQKQFQRHGYAKAAYEAGLFDGAVQLSDVMVGNCWLDRAGDDKYVLVHLEPYDEGVVQHMTDWLENVIYAFTHGEEAQKEPAREVCAATCGFYGTCRAFDTDVQGLLTDPDVVSALQQYRDGQELAKEGERLKDQAKPALADISGFAVLADGERWALRWTDINETEIGAYTRRGYTKIDFRKVK